MTNSPVPPDPPPQPESLSQSQPDGISDEWKPVLEAAQAGLKAFLRGRLAQPADVDDCMQVVLLAVIQKGRDVAPAARRAWLFRVAANESARFWRRHATTERVMEKQADYATETDIHTPDEKLSQTETTERIEKAIATLPAQWQTILRMRIHEDLTFQNIADKLNIPLGTALTQMRRAVERLQNEISEDE